VPTSPPRHGQKRVEENRKAGQREYNRIHRTGQAFYYSGLWRKVRNRYMRENPLCVECKKKGGLVVAAKVVDHIIAIKEGGDALAIDNLQSLCSMHHNQKTARERGQAIYVIVGPPCSGKSTYVNEKIKGGGVRVDFDLLALAFGAESEHEANEEIKEIVVKARYAAIREILGGVPTTAWIIETTPSSKMIEYYKESGAIFKVVDPGENICLARAAKRSAGNERLKHPPLFFQQHIG